MGLLDITEKLNSKTLDQNFTSSQDKCMGISHIIFT